MSKSRVLLVFLVLAALAPLHYLAHQNRDTRRFELGSLDRDYLNDAAEFYRPGVMMDGPIRHSDGSVEVIEFYGRLTHRDATLLLPFHAERSPLTLRMRSHRFGLEGTVALFVNDVHVNDFVFTKTSYPWGGVSAVIPQSIAETGPLRIRLVTSEGNPPPAHLPDDLGVGLDWVEVEPMSQGVRIVSTTTAWLGFSAFVVFGGIFVMATGAGFGASVFIMIALGLGASASTYMFPVPTTLALARLWVVFPLGILVFVVLRGLRSRGVVKSVTPAELAFASRVFVAAALAHSVLIFYPNHAPPDVPLHGIQVMWLKQLELSVSDLKLYSQLVSRGITEEAVMMGIGRDASIEDLRAHFASQSTSTYQTPYPPFFYLSTYALSRPWDDIRFMLEFFPVLLAASIVIIVYLVAKTMWNDVTTARVAALLMALEIAIWHHVHRGHGPGLFGALFFMGFVWFVATHRELLSSRRGMALFALLSMTCMLCYTVTLVQLLIWMAFVWVLLFASGEEERRLAYRLGLGFAIGGVGALLAFYGTYVLSALSGGGVLLDRAEAYDPPATFYFLRNQLRDSVRLLRNGYPIYLLLSGAGLALLSRSTAGRLHRTLLWSALLTYGALIVLKDPLMMPRVFLHAKEHLFFAPFACLLAALPLAAMWRAGRLRIAVVAIFIGLAFLAWRDQAWNANTLIRQPVASLRTDAWAHPA